MIKFRSKVAIAALFTTMLAVPLSAQEYEGSVGYGGGAIAFTDFNSGGSGEGFALEPGWVLVGHLEHWVAGGHIGWRLNGAFTQRPMETTDDVRSIRTWIAGADLMLRARGASGPFVAVGAGMVHYGLGSGPTVVLPAEQARYPGDSARRFAVSAGAGLDIVPGFDIFNTPAAFRIEALDHVVLDSPFEPASGSDFDPIHNLRVSFSILGMVRLLP